MTWFRQNRWYLAALAVLLPGALVVSATTDLIPFLQSDGTRIPVKAFDTVEYMGMEWSMVEHRSFDWSTEAGERAGLLEGTALVTATFAIDPGEVPTSCSFVLIDHDRIREWDDSGYGDADFEIAEDAEAYCDTEAEGPYRVQVYFIVPEEAAEGGFIEVRDSALLSKSYLEFAI